MDYECNSLYQVSVLARSLTVTLLSHVGLITTLGLSAAVFDGVTIADVQGTAWLSPYNGRHVRNLTGVVTGKVSRGIFIQDPAQSIPHISSGLYIYDSSIVRKVNVGDEVSLSGQVLDYRRGVNDIPTPNLVLTSDIRILSSGNNVTPIILGVDRTPPTQSLSALDTFAGEDAWLSVPGNQTQVGKKNATLMPDRYGLDFWRSLEGMLVTVRNPVALNFENRFGELWIRGDWPMTGLNARGGLTITFGPDGLPNSNPEAILVHQPIDGTKNPTTSIGVTMSSITGIVHYQFGFFYLLPLTAPTVQSQLPYDPPSPPYTAATDPCSIVIGDYNVENMGPDVPHLPKIAAHIVEYLKTPDLVFLQEIQDDSGKANDGTVSANLTLQSLVDAINAAGATFEYAFVDIPPVDGQDGGMPGGNIRTAYLYNPHKISLVPGSPRGGSMDSTKVVIDSAGELGLEYNPGRLDPSNAAWNMSRKPLVANWQTISGERFFTINVHYSSKSGSSPVHGDARPPVNGAVAARTSQVNVTAAFAKTLLDMDPDASLVIAGDMNEHVHVRSVFAPFDGLVQDLDVLAGIPPEERYTYVYEQNMQEIDHLFVSPAIAARGPALEHVHVNTWAPSEGERASDHDPSWAQVKVCTNLQRFAGALGHIPAPAVTQKADSFYVKRRAFGVLASARRYSCSEQLTACSELAKDGSVTKVACVTQDAQCLLRVLG